jgi:two-component system chemotaxis response regulator CheB
LNAALTGISRANCHTQLCCDKAAVTENTSDRVIVIAGSSEGIVALARLIKLLPLSLPVPLVAYAHDLRDESVEQLVRKSVHSPVGLAVVAAAHGDRLLPGHLYLAQTETSLIFTAVGTLGVTQGSELAGLSPPTDRLFESAALVYGSGVIGVVLSGNGDDGTQGLLAIFNSGGISVVQSPSEADFPSMPSNALLRDHVAHSVMLDQMGSLLARLVREPRPHAASRDESSLS